MSWPVEPERRGQPRSRTQAPVARGSRAVVGFDATEASHDALAYAVGWARRVSAHLDVLYVPEDCWRWIIEAGAAACAVGPIPDCTTDLSGVVADLLTDAGLPWSYHTASGGVAHALEQHAARIGADAIIIGRPRRHHPHMMRASIAHRLLRCTGRIVIVVP
jgi:nucleotide-binding universal stress UspA family protein